MDIFYAKKPHSRPVGKTAPAVLRVRAFRALALCVMLAFFVAAPLAASCVKIPDPPPPQPEPEVVDDPRDTLFTILSRENKHTTSLGIKRIKEFYAAAAEPGLFSRLLSSQNEIDVNLTASVSDAVISGGGEYADFVSRLLRDASLSVKCANDPATMNGMTNIGVMLSGRKLAGADILVRGGERFAIRSEELYPTYLALDYPDLMKILSDATKNDELNKLTYGSIFSLDEKLAALPGLTDVNQERSEAMMKSFVDKARDAVVKDSVTIENDVTLEGAAGRRYKKVSVALASEDLRQLLTALAQAARDDAALSALIKEKYAVIYGYASELADLGIDLGPPLNSLPPVESIEGTLQSSFAAFEVMLGSAEGLPVKAVKLELYVNGTVLECVNMDFWTAPEGTATGTATSTATGTATGAGGASAGGSGANAGGSGAGEPAFSIRLRSLDEPDGRRQDLLAAAFGAPGAEKSAVSINSELNADKNGGLNTIDVSLSGPVFANGINHINMICERGRKAKSFTLSTGMTNAAGAEMPLMRFKSAVAENENGSSYNISAELDLNDSKFLTRSRAAGGGPGDAGKGDADAAGTGTAVKNGANDAGDAGDAGKGGADNDGSPAYAVSIRCEGRLTFAQVDIPPLDDENILPLTQESFYDGTINAIYDDFYANLIRFASANRQLLSLYGFPGF